jgi:NAD(P)-dependent dehydrogenase (short-subunit alcohol dehydrogenase family)
VTPTIPRDYEGRVALVTGAGAGIGRAIALRLAAAGASVGCADVHSATAKSTARAIEAAGGRALALHADVSLEADVEHMIAATAEAFGGLDVLVNNAGIVQIQGFEESTLEDWDRTLEVNLRAAFLCCQRALVWLRRSQAGAIVNLASMAATRFTVPHIPYAASKAGIVALTRDLAVELAPHRIRVNAVAPGPIATGMVRTLTDEEIEASGMRFLLGRMGRPEDVAEAVAFLACERAAYVTGAVLPVTGGAELAIRPVLPGES